MEIKELVSFYINEPSQTLDVSFRMLSDSEDEFRTDQINFDVIRNFGYDIILTKVDEFEDLIDEEEFEYEDFRYYIDEDELYEDVVSFLNEYYLINPKSLPKSEFF